VTRTNGIAALACGIALLCAPDLAAKEQSWVEVRSPHFIIVSNAGEKQARETAIHLEQIRAFFRQVITVAQNAPSPTIIVFAVKDENSLRDLLPEYWAKGHGHPAGIFLGGFYQLYAAVELDAPSGNPYLPIYHEYYHSLTVPYLPNLPVWIAEGFAEFFGNSEIDDKKAYAGQPDPGLIQVLQQNRLIPLNVLFNVDHTSPYYNEQNKMSEFYAESWALVHYLMMGDNTGHRQMLSTYLSALDHGATQEQASTQAFGDLHKLESTLQDYARSDRFYRLEAAAPPKPSEADLQVRPLSEAEVDAEKGGFEASRRANQQADSLLQEAIRLDPNLALARQNLALHDMFEGKLPDALDSASQAVALDPKNTLGLFLRAFLTLRNGEASTQVPQMEADLRQCIAQKPDFAPAYALLSNYLASDEATLPEAFAVAQKAVVLEPGTTGFQINLAQVLMHMRRYDDAQTVATRARANAVNPGERGEAERLISEIGQMRSFESGNRPTNSDAPNDAPEPQHRDAPQAQPESEPSAPASADSGNAKQVTGVVTKLSCNPAMRLEVTAPDGTYDLYTAPGERTQFEAASQPPAGFNPCSSLKGLRVTVQYVPDDAKPHRGKVQMLEVLSWNP
jgi:tetratricopeptide (TPR) repeat protein